MRFFSLQDTVLRKTLDSIFIGLIPICFCLITYKYYTFYFTKQYNENYSITYIENYVDILKPIKSSLLQEKAFENEYTFANDLVGTYVPSMNTPIIPDSTKTKIRSYEDSILCTKGTSRLLSLQKLTFIRTQQEIHQANILFPKLILAWFFAILFYSILTYLRKKEKRLVEQESVTEYYYLTSAVFLWVIYPLISLYFPEETPITLWFKIVISILNSLCFILTVPYVEINSIDRTKWTSRLLPHFYAQDCEESVEVKHKVYKDSAWRVCMFFIWLMTVLTLMTILIHTDYDWYSSVIRFIDLGYSIPTICILWATFYFAFSERIEDIFKQVNIILLFAITFSLVCTLAVQLFRIPFIELWIKYLGVSNFLYLDVLFSFSYQFSLLALLIFLIFSGRERKLTSAKMDAEKAEKEALDEKERANRQEAKATQEAQNAKKEKVIADQEKQKAEEATKKELEARAELANQIESAKNNMAEMTHRVRGHLGNIIDILDLELLKPNITGKHLDLCNNLLAKSKAMYWLHDRIIQEIKNEQLKEMEWPLDGYIEEIIAHLEIIFECKIRPENKQIEVGNLLIKKMRFAAILSEVLMNAMKYANGADIQLSITIEDIWLKIRVVNPKNKQEDKVRISMGKDIIDKFIEKKGGYCTLAETAELYDLTIYLPLSKL